MATVLLDFQFNTICQHEESPTKIRSFWGLFESKFVTQGGLPVTGGFIAALVDCSQARTGQAPHDPSACKLQVVKQATLFFSCALP